MNYNYLSNKKFSLIVGVVVLGIAAFYFSFTSNNIIFGLASDDAVYLLQADAYSPWQKETHSVINYIREQSQFPPLYPMLLGVLNAGSDHLAYASNITIVCLLLALFCVGFFTYTVTRSRAISIALACVIAFLPDSLMFSQGLWSEFLFMCLTYGAFISSDYKSTNPKFWLLTALLVALASLTRSIGLALILAFYLLLFIKRPKHSLYYMFISGMPFIVWITSRHLLVNNVDYLSAFFQRTHLFNAFSLFDLALYNLQVLASTLSYYLYNQINNNIAENGLLIAVFLLSLTGYVLRLKKRELDSFFVPIYLLILLVWPYSGLSFMSRFIYPVFPIFLIYTIIALHYIFSSSRWQLYFSYLLMIAIVVMNMPTSYHYIKRGFSDVERDLKPYTRTQDWLMTKDYNAAYKTARINKKMIESLLLIPKYVPDNECIYAVQTPFVMLYTKRKTKVLPKTNVAYPNFESATRFCNYILAMPILVAVRNHSPYPPYYPPPYPLYYPFEILKNNPKYKMIPIRLEHNKTKEIVLILIKRIKKNGN